jgi:PAS domain S-box-containing protein
VVWLGLLLSAFYLAFRYGVAFSQTVAAPFWLPGPLLLAALLYAPRRWWPLLLVATVAIHLWIRVPSGTPIWFLLATSIVDCGTSVLAAVLLRWRLQNPFRFDTPREFGIYCLLAVFLAPAVGSIFGALTLLGLGSNYWVSLEQWFWGNALANLIITPFIFYWILRPPSGTRAKLSALRTLEATLLIIGLPASLWLALRPYTGGSIFLVTQIYAPLAFVIWAAARFGLRGSSGAIFLVTIFAVVAAYSHTGPFSGDSPNMVARHMQTLLLFQAAPLYLVGVLSDAGRRAEHSIRESERRFRDIADTAPVLIWAINQDKNCTFLNKGWLDFTGRTPDQQLGRGWRESIHPDDVEHVDKSITSIDGRLPFELEYRLRRHDGEYRWILTRGVPRYGTDGAFLGCIGSAIDVTERKRLEEAGQKLNHAARLATLGELTGVVSHEINQPLFAILSNTEAADILMQQEDPPIDEVRQILADIYKDDLRASEVIRVVRSLTHKRTPKMGAINLNDLLVSIGRLVKADAARRRVEIHQELGANLPLVMGDESSLEQVVLNLLINGMDAMRDTPEATRQITVTTRRGEHDDVQIAISDHGHGIAADKMPQLFDSFFTTKPDGMGLGLSTARQIVQSHKGRIWAVNNPTGGATFYVTLPAVDAKPSDAPGDGAEASELTPTAVAIQSDWIGTDRYQAH